MDELEYREGWMGDRYALLRRAHDDKVMGKLGLWADWVGDRHALYGRSLTEGTQRVEPGAMTWKLVNWGDGWIGWENAAARTRNMTGFFWNIWH